MYKVAIISCGMIANSAHIPAYRHLKENFNITAVCDINETAARETAKRFGIPKYYTDAEQMLEEQKPDVVSICVPNSMHRKYTMMALFHGCHVLCEKPLAFNYTDAAEMYDFAKKQNKLLMACQSMRFTPDRLAAKKLIDEGGLGEIYYCDFSRIRRRGIPTWGSFHLKEVSGGGAFVDIGVHMIDAVLWLMGNPKVRSIQATTLKKHHDEIGTLKDSGALTGEVYTKRQFDPSEINVETFSSGSILLENNARINFKVAWAANSPDETSIKLIGNKAGIDLPDGKIYSGSADNTALTLFKNKYPSEAFGGHFYLIDNLLEVLDGKAEPAVKPEETINVARVLEGFYKSAQTGREVIFND